MEKNALITDLRALMRPFASLKAWTLLCLVMLSVVSAKAQTPYAIWCEENSTLYFTNSYETYAADGNYHGLTITQVWSGEAVTNVDAGSTNQPQWTSAAASTCTKVVIEENFKSVKPTSLNSWFYNFKQLTTIEGLRYLDTSEATTMRWMFSNCQSLASLDLSHFNTRNVTNMNSMFSACQTLTTLDLRSLDMSKVTTIQQMFQDCSSLETIYCNEDWSMLRPEPTSANMFDGCTSLKGGNGTEYNSGYKQISRARPDGGVDAPGYFTINKYKYVIWCEDNATLYFTYSGLECIKGGSHAGHTVTQYWTEENGGRVFDYDNPEYPVPLWTIDSDNQPSSICEKCQTVVFDPSFSEVKPTSTAHWFSLFKQLTSIEGLQYLNTSEVTSMNAMFDNCSSLTSLDLSNFNTSKVINMSWMFGGCSSLASLDLSKFDTSKVQTMQRMFSNCSNLTSIEPSSFNTENVWDMREMFNDCSSLTSLDLNNFNTTKVEYMEFMFAGCSNLTSIDLSSFNTANTTSMNSMFAGCSSLTSIDLSNFNTANTTSMNSMFAGCSSLTSIDLTDFNLENAYYFSGVFHGCTNLKTIYCDYDWNNNKNEYQNTITDVFTGCTSLVGGSGTAYNENHTDTEYARPDDLIIGGKPGYFSKKPYVIWCEEIGTLYFTCSLEINPVVGEEYYSFPVTNLWRDKDVTETGNQSPKWAIAAEKCKTVIFDASFRIVKPTSMNRWFYNFRNLTTIDGLPYLNTTEVTDMTYTFTSCEQLKKLDVSNFRTGNVTGMSNLFANCSAVKTLDLRKFDLRKVTTIQQMFEDCSSLETIYCNDDWSKLSPEPNNTDMFRGCSSLVGGKGTAYDISHRNIFRARPDDGEDAPGYFTEKQETNVFWCDDNATLYFTYGTPVYNGNMYDGNIVSIAWQGEDMYPNPTTPDVPVWIMDEEIAKKCKTVVFDESISVIIPTQMSKWFVDFQELTSINGLEYINTSEVTDMHEMFKGCSSLTNIDLSHFNTEKVTNMYNMFAYCNNLTSLDLSKFNTANVQSMEGMFAYCNSLTGLDLSKFNTANVTNMKELFFNCKGLTSLDLTNFNTEKVEDMANMFNNCYSLTGITFGDNFKTNKVSSMQSMFFNCRNLTELDLRGFNPESLKYALEMFSSCENLTTIRCGYDWRTEGIFSENMFLNCNKLVGVNGTTYDVTNVNYAHPDWEDDPGYFTIERTPYAIWCADSKTLYFNNKVRTYNADDTYNGQTITSIWSGEQLTNYGENKPLWINEDLQAQAQGCHKVVFEENFHTLKLTNMKYWFFGLRGLTEISGLENVNTSDVTNMNSMFTNCKVLTELDVSSFDTHNVTTMSGMFRDTSLRELDLRRFNISNVTDMSYMFKDCKYLTTIYCNDDWSSVKETYQMFYGCESLVGGNKTAFDSSHIDGSYARPDVEGTPGYFTFEKKIYALWCENSKTVYLIFSDKKYMPGQKYNGDVVSNVADETIVMEGLGNYYILREKCKLVKIDESFSEVEIESFANWFSNLRYLEKIEGLQNLNTTAATSMAGMFNNCSALAEIEGLDQLNTENVTSMADMFAGSTNLHNIDLTNFDTGNVTDMSNMFNGCSRLYELNLNSFNTSKVTDMTSMFDGCMELQRIYCDHNWKRADGVPVSDNMFNNCYSLMGSASTQYDYAHTNADYAHPGVPGNPGYFTLIAEYYDYTISSAMVGTYYSPVPLTIPDDADFFYAFYVSSISENGTIHLKKVLNAIPALTGVVIFGNEGTYTLSVNKTSDCLPIEDNLLKGVLEDTSVEDLKAEHGTDIYVLSRGTDSYVNFHKVGSTVNTIPANKAYLPYTSANGANELGIVFDEDGIQSIETGDAGNAKTGVYNLAGQRVTNPKHGIYIVNGKKVYIP